MEEIKELTPEKLKEITKNGKVVLLFSATWCPDCRFLDPFLPQIEKDNSDAKFYKIDRDGSIDVAKELNIFGIPSFVVYQDGKEIGRLVNKDRKTKEEVETHDDIFTLINKREGDNLKVSDLISLLLSKYALLKIPIAKLSP